MSLSLNGQTAVVTGGNAGIGKAIAEAFAAHGANLALFGTNEERGRQAAVDISGAHDGVKARFFQVDVSNTVAMDQALKEVYDDFGAVDILVNNAGITRDGLLMKMNEEDWDNVMAVNVKSCYNSCRSVIRAMLKARRGKIINISSVIGLTGNPGQANYAASKSAIIGFSKALAREVASRNICVNCVAPGFIHTTMTDAMTELQKESVLAKIPLGRIGQPHEVANAVLFLASALSDYITGQVIIVDGGMVI